MKEKLLQDLAKYPRCDFFLQQCVTTMTEKQVTDDLAEEPDQSLLQHFDKPDQMGLLEELFARTMKNFGLSKEALKAKAGFNFDVYDSSSMRQQGLGHGSVSLDRRRGVSDRALPLTYRMNAW